MALTKSIEQIEIVFDSWWWELLAERENERTPEQAEDDKRAIDITVRDGMNVAVIVVSIDEAKEVRDLLDKAIAEAEGWKPKEKGEG